MSVAFVCSECSELALTTIARFCATCRTTYIAGYECVACGHDDVDAPGQEPGHAPHPAPESTGAAASDGAQSAAPVTSPS